MANAVILVQTGIQNLHFSEKDWIQGEARNDNGKRGKNLQKVYKKFKTK